MSLQPPFNQAAVPAGYPFAHNHEMLITVIEQALKAETGSTAKQAYIKTALALSAKMAQAMLHGPAAETAREIFGASFQTINERHAGFAALFKACGLLNEGTDNMYLHNAKTKAGDMLYPGLGLRNAFIFMSQLHRDVATAYAHHSFTIRLRTGKLPWESGKRCNKKAAP